MKKYPFISPQKRLERLKWPAGKLRLAIDTDTYNEIDDQFALIYALLSPERLQIEAVYAAPFHNARSTSPEDGMEKSYQEILRLLDLLKISEKQFVYKGSRGFLKADQKPFQSDAASDLVNRALSSPPDDPLYVVAIGAITNIASAILIEPAIIERIVVVWLGGHALDWPDTSEFNLKQDIMAARLIFDCGVPLVHIPCMGVSSTLTLDQPDVDHNIRGRGVLGEYLCEIFSNFKSDASELPKIIWDLAAVAYLINDKWTETELVKSPIISDQLTWKLDNNRHLIRYCSHLDRNPVYQDLFRKLEKYAKFG